MGILEQVKLLLHISDNTEDDLISLFIDNATTAVMNKRYPFPTSTEKSIIGYENVVISIAIYLYNKQGVEGQLAHTENGITRTYESGGIPKSMLSSVISEGGVI